jgi:hypothetical protein
VHAPVVDLDANINKRNQWLLLKARLEKHRVPAPPQ